MKYRMEKEKSNWVSLSALFFTETQSFWRLNISQLTLISAHQSITAILWNIPIFFKALAVCLLPVSKQLSGASQSSSSWLSECVALKAEAPQRPAVVWLTSNMAAKVASLLCQSWYRMTQMRCEQNTVAHPFPANDVWEEWASLLSEMSAFLYMLACLHSLCRAKCTWQHNNNR